MLDLNGFLMKCLLKYKLLLISLILISSCASDRNMADATYFGGKIINPKSKDVYFYKNHQLLDSAQLDFKNKFLFKFDSLKVGLYTFEHSDEVQFLFLEPGDSLLLRLNTWDFDESLVYSGKGAEKNNLLINMFLENEKEDTFILKYYALNDSLFELKIDSLLQLKKLLYKQYKEEVTGINPLFDKFMNAAIHLPLYKKKEAYPYRNKRALKLAKYPTISPLFYKYRKGIDFKDEDLQNFYAYTGYIRDYLRHIGYEKTIINEGSHSKANFIEATVNHLHLDDLQSRFLYEGMWNIMLDDYITASETKRAQDLFFNNCKDEELKENIGKLVKASESPKKGVQFPIIKVFSYSDEHISINDHTENHNSVIYFWPKGPRQIRNLAKRIKYLEKKHPTLKFIGIDANHVDYNWKSYIKANKFNPNTQFRLDAKSNDNDWLFIDYSRTILVDKNGIVQNGFTHLRNPKFTHQLKKLKKD